ncbi:acyl carrier protein [Streptomyces sp. SAI-208]|jgi:acyl carrier protein|uniref:acyl carrier protein n=1 Tax=unclassified Streptomyces TaxID=2593676 RepID=UPI002472F910|nr:MULTISPECIES: acyl carrier protein [unclassified Streptomyces]MDH6515142.1 acyl carrier protein [Streptomyces sp. SAI-090]MDH6566439.1 acyl carrier protein [Streptomyces sp. SAI-117]MDH6588623.1 acyl carrier protein [Streptomyces sp. SAI-133]MDH6605987.1 acyl carrier protein [Streptomyces sp. SAI-208]MDH6620773.1 acyl carrier protein [Streptomyces sp. SAI-135]
MTAVQSDTLQTLKEILDEVAGVPAEDVTPDSSFTEDLALDSLTVVSLFVLVQRRFGTEVPNEVFDRLTTVGKAVAYLERGEIPA